MSYQPYSLPRLPRHQCPYETLELYRDKTCMRVKAGPCHNLVDKNTGWCEEHQYVYELLEAAVAAGCPPSVLIVGYNPTTKKHDVPVLTVGAGLAAWEGYAQRHTLRHHEEIMKKLREIKTRNDEADKKAVAVAVAKSARNAA
jgi:hypothetical protein